MATTAQMTRKEYKNFILSKEKEFEDDHGDVFAFEKLKSGL